MPQFLCPDASIHPRCKVLTGVMMKMQVYWDMTLCIGLFHPEDEGTRSSNLLNDTVSQPTRSSYYSPNDAMSQPTRLTSSSIYHFLCSDDI